MTLRISGRNMDLGDSLRARIEERIADAAEKYFGERYTGRVTIEKDGNFFEADCMLHLDSGIVLQAGAREADPTGSFDKACERIEKRLRRYKRKLKAHKGRGAEDDFAPIEANLTVMETADADEELSEEYAPTVVAEGATSVRTQTVAMAVMQLELMDDPVNVFRNAATGAVNVVYRRADGHVGWVDPGPSGT